jgi:hypothetical protein
MPEIDFGLPKWNRNFDLFKQFDDAYKVTSANQADKDSAQALRAQAMGKRMTKNITDCENLLNQAIALVPA